MLTRKSILALAIVTTFGAAALVTTPASAFGHFGGGGHFGGAHFGGGHFGEHFGSGRFADNRWDRRFDRHEWYGWHRPHYGVVVGDPGYVTNPVPDTTTTQAEGPCNCLHKKYLNNGSVVFWDSCAKEEAIATPEELKAQANGEEYTKKN